MAFGNRALAMEVDISDLQNLISSNEDMRMDSRGHAFFLNTHNYEVVSMDGDVEANLLARHANSVQMTINRGYAAYNFNLTFQDYS
jgi:hypothetical protein